MRVKHKRHSPLFENAIDSLGIGIKFFLDERSKTAKKHAILMLFNSIELLLKEELRRVNSLLIYRDIDKKITEASLTVGLQEILVRLDNLHLSLPTDEKVVLDDLRLRRNIIEHHRYDPSPNDALVIGKALRFITWFISDRLKHKLNSVIEKKLLKRVLKLVLDYKEYLAIAEYDLEEWIVLAYSEDGDDPNDPSAAMDRFPGTLECPQCNQEMLVMDFRKKLLPIRGKKRSYCFYCGEALDVAICECGRTYLSDGTSPSPCCGAKEAKLYIGGVSYNSTSRSLAEAFGKAGVVNSVEIIMDKMTTRSKGFGFVAMASQADAEAAIEMWNGKELDGRKLTVNFARPREERPPRY